MESKREMETSKEALNPIEIQISINHFGHVHSLIFFSSKIVSDDLIGCRGCWRQIEGAHYGCQECKYFLHQVCALFPLEIDHPMHPDHRLSLVCPPPEYRRGICECRACGKDCKGFVYHCTECTRFDIDLLCAFVPNTIETAGHLPPYPSTTTLCKNLSYTLLLQPAARFSCNKCLVEVDNKSISYICFVCQNQVHLDCALAPHQLSRINEHVHCLEFTYLYQVQKEKLIPMNIHCEICEKKIAIPVNTPKQVRRRLKMPQVPVYSCVSCNHYFHPGCATLATRANRSAEDIVMQYVKDSSRGDSNRGIHKGLLRRQKQEAETRSRDLQIKHWSHDHLLDLGTTTDEIPGFDRSRIRCEGCKWPLLPPFYSCFKCDYFLHAACAELPILLKPEVLHIQELGSEDKPGTDEVDSENHTKEVESHEDETETGVDDPSGHILHLKMIETGIDPDSSCSNCHNVYSGFSYECQVCSYTLDLSCANISKNMKHEAHDHVLYFAKEGRPSEHCHACGKFCTQDTYFCSFCDDFYLDAKCASLPETIRHRFDHHPLTLVFKAAENELGEYICEICEDQHRNPKLWFYGCEDCDFAAHPDCIFKQE